MATPTTLPATFVSGAVLTAAQMNNLRGAFRVLQVVSTTKTDTCTHSTGVTFSNVTGLSAAITPSATSSKVLIYVYLEIGGNNSGTWVKVTGGNTASWVGDTAGSRARIAFAQNGTGGTPQVMMNASAFYLDSPATTSAITYQVQIAAADNATTTYINRSTTDTDSTGYSRATSGIVVMEISA